MTFALALYTLFGHAFLWIGAINRLHAIALPRWIIGWITKAGFFFIGAAPIVALCWWLSGGDSPFAGWDASLAHRPGRMLFPAYICVCWLAGAGTLLRWFWHNLYFRRPAKLLRFDQRQRAEISPAARPSTRGKACIIPRQACRAIKRCNSTWRVGPSTCRACRRRWTA